MGRNEIRLRKKAISSGKLARYKNYEHLMARHERDVRIKRLSKLIVIVLIVVILLCTFFAAYIIRYRKAHPIQPVKTTERLVVPNEQRSLS